MWLYALYTSGKKKQCLFNIAVWKKNVKEMQSYYYILAF